MSTIGARLREERERLGLSQTAFGEIGGVGKLAQIKYEKGERSPDTSYLAAIADRGADVLYIVSGERQTPEERERLATVVDRLAEGEAAELPMGDFAARLRHLIGDVPVSRFATEVGLGDNLVKKYLAGSKPGLDKINRIAIAKRVDLNWLALGDGAAPPRGGYSSSVRAGFIYVPRYSVKAHAGGGAAVESEQIVDYLAFKRDWFERNVGIGPDNAALIEVRGESMTPVLQDGELVIIDMSCTNLRDDAIYVLQYSGGLRIKSVRRRVDGKIEIRSANEDYGVEVLSEKEAEAGTFTIVGRARWALSGRRLP